MDWSQCRTPAYIKHLNALAERDRAQRAEREHAAAKAKLQAARERLTPLEDRLARLLATISVEIQRQGLSLSSLQTSLRGRWRGNCHPGELGAALRKLGFKRERRWHDGDGFVALWYPPQRTDQCFPRGPIAESKHVGGT